MKKPQALIGLLAALGTAIGVMVAIVGLPYGRVDYTAFADLYHNGGTPALGEVHLAVDCDTSDHTDDSACSIPVTSVAPIDIAVSIGNNTGALSSISSFDFKLVNDNQGAMNPLPGSDANLNGNPDFYEPDHVIAGWTCGLPPPVPDSNGSASISSSDLTCYSGNTPFPSSPIHQWLGVVHYSDDAAAPGVANLTLEGVAVGDAGFNEIASCNPVIATSVSCFPAVVTFFIPTATNTPVPTDTPAATVTNTPTNTATATNTATNTATATNTPLGASVIKVPESCTGAGSVNCDDTDPQQPLVNLWICQSGPCAGEGEGNLIVFEYATNVQTGDQNGDTIEDGLGAYEFDIEYNNLVIASVNPCDIVFSPTSVDPNNPGGSDGLFDPTAPVRGPVDELNGQNNPYCSPDVGAINQGTCAMSIVTENVVHFGCVTSGATPGPTGSFDLAALNLIPHEDMAEDLFPGNDNGVVVVIKDNGCELVDVFGHPVVGSVNGGLTQVCGDATITVRILEGDLDLDCDVDVSDAQRISWRYGSFFGSLLYSQWFDLEPNLHDLDIDIKDLQKVFGRFGSTCQNPIPAQTPVPFN